jgi:hypothetical protein
MREIHRQCFISGASKAHSEGVALRALAPCLARCLFSSLGTCF